MNTYKIEEQGRSTGWLEREPELVERRKALAEAEAAFDAYYARGGTGQADQVWLRIATRYGVLGFAS